MIKELPACPVETTLSLISSRWTVLIIRELLTGTKRFNELKRSINILTQKILTSNLRNLEENGLIERTVSLKFLQELSILLQKLGLV